MLNSEYYFSNYSSPGLKDIISQSIRQFPEITSDHKRTWKNVSRYLKHLKISKRASKIIDKNISNKELWKLLHYEHIEPISVTLKRLIELGINPSLNQVTEIMKDCEVIILSKEEAKVLDGSKDKLYDLEGKKVYGVGLRSRGTKEERMNSIGIEIDPRYVENKL